jgi:short-subunit dehydrogenase
MLALITGASAGIGATFARRLSREGYQLILVARRGDRLEALARELGSAEVLPADLADDAGLRTVEARIAAAPALDLLINNAGFGTEGCFFEVPVESQDQMHRLHVMATMRLSHAALRVMVPRGRGAVINVSSVAGYGQGPGSVSYCATKAWMNSFTEGLNLELRGSGSPVRVQALCPGFTVSEFHHAMGADPKKIPAWLWMKAEDVVDASLRGLAAGKPVVVPGVLYKTIVRLESWVPKGLRTALVVRAARKRGKIKAAPSDV